MGEAAEVAVAVLAVGSGTWAAIVEPEHPRSGQRSC